MRVSKQGWIFFSESEKHKIIQEVLSGRITKEAAQRKYGIRGKSAILKWMRTFGYMTDLDPSVVIAMARKKRSPQKPDLSDDPVLLKQHIEKLEKELKAAKLNALAQSTMIDVAEQTFKIPIRKKSVTKQSPK